MKGKEYKIRIIPFYWLSLKIKAQMAIHLKMFLSVSANSHFLSCILLTYKVVAERVSDRVGVK